MSEIKKTEKYITGGAYLGSSTVRPSQLAGPASSRPSPPPSSVVFVPTEGGECGRRARAPPRHATCSPACLPSPPRSMPRTTPRPPPCSLSLSRGSSPPLPRSLSHGRTPPSPPFALATDSNHPSLPRLAQELRLDSLFLPTAPQLPGGPASPPRRRSPLRAPTVVAVEFTVTSASPSSLTIPAAPR